MIRRVLKSAFATAVHHARAEGLLGLEPDRRRAPFVVCYHRVVEDVRASVPASLPAMLISRDTLERHLDWMATRFDLISLDEVGERIMGRRRSPRPAAAVTFDDGYQDVADLAIPLLQRKGIPAAIFVVTDRVGTSRIHAHDRLYLLLSRLLGGGGSGRALVAQALRDAGLRDSELPMKVLVADSAVVATEEILAELDQLALSGLVDRLEAAAGFPTDASADHALMDWPALAKLADAGFTIGSHGRSHALLAHECARDVLRELLGSRLELERRLGRSTHHLAYPAGSFDATTVRIAAAAGYRYAYACCSHGDARLPQMTIPRRVFWENTGLGSRGEFSPALLSCQIHGVVGFGVRCPGHARRVRSAAPAPEPAWVGR